MTVKMVTMKAYNSNWEGEKTVIMKVKNGEYEGKNDHEDYK